MNISENVKIVQEMIANSAAQSGRKPEDIVLVAASKMNSAERVQQAIAAGVDTVGENRVQEMLEKNELGAYEGAQLHFIGHLQKNKVNKVVGLCKLIESVDSCGLLEQISKKSLSMGIKQNILIEVNIGRESAKSGVMPEDLLGILDYASTYHGIFVQGLMAVPPVSEKPGGNRPYFEAMYEHFINLKSQKFDNVSMQYLSMGMSKDYTDAIAAGANVVRVGSAIFGERIY